MEQRRKAPEPQPSVLHVLQPDERIEIRLVTTDGELLVTDRRLLLTVAGLVRLDIGYEELRRIQFDIEAGRPATLVIVPHRASKEPQVLAVPVDSLHIGAELLAVVGERLA